MQTEWNLTALEGDFNAKRALWKKATDNFISKWKKREDYLKNPAILKEALDDFELWCKNFGAKADEAYYFWLKNAKDQNNTDIKARFNKVEEFSKKVITDISFFELNIAKIPRAEQEKFLKFDELKDYKHFLEKLFATSKYMLSESEEKIMILKSSASYDFWIKMVSGFLAKEERYVLDENGCKVKKTFSDLFGLLKNKNQKVRDSSAEAINEILLKHSDVAEAEINALLADKKINDELREYTRPDQARHIADDIDTTIIDTVIRTVHKHFYISRRYYELKSKLLKVKKLKYHERLADISSTNKKYDYKKALDLVLKVFRKLDPKFENILKQYIENGQIDVYPKKGKTSGAFCVHFLKTQPVYVLLNHTNRLCDVTTLAHEMGHAINNELMREQNSLNFGTTLSTAEVASTFMEDFVLEEIIKSSDDETKLDLFMEKLDSDISTIIRQVACYTFEQELHKTFRKEGYLSKEKIGKLFQKHMSSYMGPYVEQSPGSENWWIYWSHIRRYFYNYSYASGLLISKLLQKQVREDSRNIEKVKKFLSAGISKSPKDIFASCGLDITKKEFWEDGLNELEKFLKETHKLARKIGKI